jgi:hypothetical protein
MVSMFIAMAGNGFRCNADFVGLQASSARSVNDSQLMRTIDDTSTVELTAQV